MLAILLTAPLGAFVADVTYKKLLARALNDEPSSGASTDGVYSELEKPLT